jgi:hypothetical protein
MSVALGAVLAAAAPLAGQGGGAPALFVTLRRSAPDTGRVAEVEVGVRDLLERRGFLDALQSGFPLYVEFRVSLKRSQAIRDRTVDDAAWDLVVLHDPVRDAYVLETSSGREILPHRDALRGRLARVYLVGLTAPQDGQYYYAATMDARMLSDDDVDEAFAWLRGEGADSARLRDPGIMARLARRVLMRVSGLPSLRLEARSERFTVP